MHAKMAYKPDEKEKAYKPGPGNYSPDSIAFKRKMP